MEFKMGALSKMGEWKDRLFGRWRNRRKEQFQEEDLNDVDWRDLEQKEREWDVNDEAERREFIQGRLDQITEASEELEKLSVEYATVTAYLKDMEEIEALPETEMAVLAAGAEKIQGLEKKRGGYLRDWYE